MKKKYKFVERRKLRNILLIGSIVLLIVILIGGLVAREWVKSVGIVLVYLIGLYLIKNEKSKDYKTQEKIKELMKNSTGRD